VAGDIAPGIVASICALSGDQLKVDWEKSVMASLDKLSRGILKSNNWPQTHI